MKIQENNFYKLRNSSDLFFNTLKYNKNNSFKKFQLFDNIVVRTRP